MSPASAPIFVDPYSSSGLVDLETTQHAKNEPCILAYADAPTPNDSFADPDEIDPGVLFRHSAWTPNRRCVEDVLALIPQAANRLIRFQHCGEHAWVMQSVADPQKYRLACNKCRDRFCEPCARDRARHVASCVAIFAAERDMRLITLTLRQTTATMKQDIDRLYRSFTEMRRAKEWKRTQEGGIYFCEIKRRRNDDGWHTHMHILSEGWPIDKQWLRSTWLKITGDSYIVHIRRCTDASHAAYYVAKYASKGVHGSCYKHPLMLREAMMAIKGRRLVGKYGSWAALDLKTEILTDDWLPVASLSGLLIRSNAGESFASHVLEMLRSQSCRPTERSPPDPQPQSSFDYPESQDVQAAASGSIRW